MPIKATHRAVAREYARNGGNAKKAYAKYYPGASDATAETNGPKLLRRAQTQAVVEQTYEKDVCKSLGSRDRLLECSEAVREQAMEKGQLASAVSSIKVMGELSGAFRDSQGAADLASYTTFIESLTVNVGTPDARSVPIDVTPEKKKHA